MLLHLDDALPTFNVQAWIGVGKVFTSPEIPFHVLLEKQKQLVIPDAHLAYFPAADLPVVKFIQLSLPIQSTIGSMLLTKGVPSLGMQWYCQGNEEKLKSSRAQQMKTKNYSKMHDISYHTKIPQCLLCPRIV